MYKLFLLSILLLIGCTNKNLPPSLDNNELQSVNNNILKNTIINNIKRN